MIKGSLVAVVSPMKADGTLDFDAYRNLLDWHIESGTSAIVAVGTTGESPTVSVEEHAQLIRVAAEHCRGRVPVIAGTGANSTREAIELTRHAFEVGVDASLQVAPYYNKPSQEGMFRHFTTVAQEGGLPVILYNVPGRTVADISNDTVLRLAANPNIIGIKDATGDVGRGASLLARLPEGFAVYSGNDDSALALMAMGAHGVISVTANVAPRQMADMCAAALAGDFGKALAINRTLISLHERLFMEPNPVPTKWALARMGRIASPVVRLPLAPLTTVGQTAVLDALQSSGVLA
ncbi:4-hydroxy-tetrahydrodipicolinate synthase [Lautropia dentalis]|uniref:4-hydroxy-tetrahydrodipicolinate synthase n=1 Tax=Lautropia dentalis TaxID=2490857 RepID=A0A426FTS5_9BURK|nr:4-hydroxy-tetrahydrodipicolinate synthase [Lautropia dentalis]RRN46070.1 4-hydroxy-tetrahydrodipicolinate synthase [Lautropia dentalis]